MSKKLTTEDFIIKAKKMHGNKYNYSKVEYINSSTKVCIICPIHGEFWQRPDKHLKGQGCPECGKNKTIETTKLTFQEFREKANLKHRNKYSYVENTYINTKNIVSIICPLHGIFKQEGQSHLQGHGCPKCNQRKLEKDIENYLINNHIDYIFQAKKRDFEWLDKQSFDFYLPKYNIAIECQGEQHFKQKFNFQGHISTENEIENIIKRDYHKYNLANSKINGIMYYTYKKWFPQQIDDYRLNEMYKNIFFNIDELFETITEKKAD